MGGRGSPLNVGFGNIKRDHLQQQLQEKQHKMKRLLLAYLIFAFLVVTGVAGDDKCPLPEGEAKGLMPGDVVDDESICLPTGDDHLTFAMLVGMTSFGVPGSTAATTRFLVLDHTCKVLGHYYPASKCGGTPWKLEAPYLHYMLIIESVFMDPGDPYFSFAYANGLYSIGNNHCTCQGSQSGLHVQQGCKCAFPIDGEPQ
ncbi:hypothetical protein TRICI_005782 [Trichomonascus ciferrii]|uniref:Uncharacterized protein n=1 Tax=Trichomonascus ciferrii TaxID=44093 RepID=A0A642UPI0_9ASCO|nr:hypothetical protein TRICI_005782 [Trichomonascus ciferrii]